MHCLEFTQLAVSQGFDRTPAWMHMHKQKHKHTHQSTILRFMVIFPGLRKDCWFNHWLKLSPVCRHCCLPMLGHVYKCSAFQSFFLQSCLIGIWRWAKASRADDQGGVWESSSDYKCISRTNQMPELSRCTAEYSVSSWKEASASECKQKPTSESVAGNTKYSTVRDQNFHQKRVGASVKQAGEKGKSEREKVQGLSHNSKHREIPINLLSEHVEPVYSGVQRHCQGAAPVPGRHVPPLAQRTLLQGVSARQMNRNG